MAKLINRLSARSVGTICVPGLHADGGGLYLNVTNNGGRHWVFIFRWLGKRREMGLGSYRDVPLALARKLATSARENLAQGIDPKALRDSERAAAKGRAEAAVTFGTFADTYISDVEGGWRNPKHRQQWRNSLRDHAGALTNKPVADIDTDDVLGVLKPIWQTVPETASRVRGRIEKILSAAKAKGLRPRDAANPAQWRGHLEVLLPKRLRLTRGHHAAMPYAELPVFMRKLSDRPAVAARALEFLIFNASRTGEVLGARWREIDGNLWTIPAERMKAGIPHTVTLSPAAVSILEEIGPGDPQAYVFPGQKPQMPLSGMSMEMLLRRMNLDQFTVHGFRSSFKDWALNCTEFPDELSEEALAHVIGSKVRRAYRRGEALERRRKLMDAWANFLAAAPVLTIVEEEAA